MFNCKQFRKLHRRTYCNTYIEIFFFQLRLENIESVIYLLTTMLSIDFQNTSIGDLQRKFEYNFDINDTAITSAVDSDAAFTYENPNKSSTFKAAQPMVDFLNYFIRSITQMQLKQRDINKIFRFCIDLTEKIKALDMTLMEKDIQLSPQEAINVTTDLVCRKLFAFDSAYKRKQEFASNEFYVPPGEVAIGNRMEMKKIKSRRNGKIMYVPRVIQCKFQYVSILNTIRSLFKCDEFRKMYLDYNTNKDHTCENGKYRDFCCTKTFQENEFFQRNPNALQIQIASDDFEVCNPLQSKANRHKITGIYFTIRNLPKRYLSKLSNIYLIVLCNVDDLKTKLTDFNNIWRIIVKDIKYLETVGIAVDGGLNMKGTLTQLSFDNLGANQALGFSGSFSATYYCRKCECQLEECQHLTEEKCDQKRTKESYMQQIKKIEESEKVKLKETKGVKFYCALSDCKFFHILDNPTVDVMHDINEGIIPFLIKCVINSCVASRLFSLDEVSLMIQYHDYGWLKRQNIPSELNLDKRSLGQNAKQSICLFQNLPFILYEHRKYPALKSVWNCVTSLLRIVEIVYSDEITEIELDQLKNLISAHLTGIREIGETLIPKHHFITHYPSVIRAVGPVINMTMMRYEGKHKVFKIFAEKTLNFKDINKTLAVKHQEILCSSEFTYSDKIECGKLINLCAEYTEKHKQLLHFCLSDGLGLENIYEIKWFNFNNNYYRKGLLILHDNSLHEIFDILCLHSKYFFITKQYTFVKFNVFLNSFQLEENEFAAYDLIDFDNITNKKSYEVKVIDKNKFIIADTLELRRIFCK